MVKNMELCMIDWNDATCTGRYDGTDSIPTTVLKVDECMTDVTSGSCSRYPSSSSIPLIGKIII